MESRSNIIPIAALALDRLGQRVNAVVQESQTDLKDLHPVDKVRVGELIVEAYQRAYFQGVDLPTSLAQGFAPAAIALEACVEAYLCQPKEVACVKKKV